MSRPVDLMDLAQSLIDESRRVYDEQEVDRLQGGAAYRITPLGYTRATVLAEQATALATLAQARMIGGGRAK